MIIAKTEVTSKKKKSIRSEVVESKHYKQHDCVEAVAQYNSK